METSYGFGTTLDVPYEEAIPRVKEALKAEGFGVLTPRLFDKVCSV